MTSSGQPFGFSATGGLATLGRPAIASPAAARPPAARQRARLWELNGSFHCSIIGTCLTTAELRRTMVKVDSGCRSGLTDHELHSRAVGLCGQHGISSKLLQKALDHRHETVIKRFARLHGEATVMEHWAEARGAGDIPGAYWAVLTHPDVGHTGLRQAFGDVHMLSHLVGAANRADIRRLAELEEAKAELLEKVERQQARLHEAITSRDATIRRMSKLAARTVASSDPHSDGDDVLTGLRDLVADLQDRLARETGHRERLGQRMAEGSAVSRSWERRAIAAEAEQAALKQELLVLEQHNAAVQTRTLPPQRVLYVGGRPGCVEQIREVLASSGGELLCHDGGLHDNPSLLPGLIGQADRVAFPVDCVSHEAALTVKRLCRQLGKAWLPLRSSGLSSFLAAMTESGGGGVAGEGR